jgi:hypothetical protein
MNRVKLAAATFAASAAVSQLLWHTMRAAPGASTALGVVWVWTAFTALASAVLLLGFAWRGGDLAATWPVRPVATVLPSLPLRADAPAGPRSRPRAWQPVEQLPDSLAYDDYQPEAGEDAAPATAAAEQVPDGWSTVTLPETLVPPPSMRPAGERYVRPAEPPPDPATRLPDTAPTRWDIPVFPPPGPVEPDALAGYHDATARAAGPLPRTYAEADEDAAYEGHRRRAGAVR